jgi:hypothetical protein
MNNYCKKIDIQLPKKLKTQYLENLTLVESYKAPQKYAFSLWEKEKFFPVGNDTYDVEHDDKYIAECFVPKDLLEIEYPICRIIKIDPNDVVHRSFDIFKKRGKNESKEIVKYMLPPHIDRVRKCGFNFYLETHNEETKYFRYENDKIYEDYSFIAQNGDCWLLNVDVPHAVTLNPPHVRIIFSVSFIHTPFEEVVKYFS